MSEHYQHQQNPNGITNSDVESQVDGTLNIVGCGTLGKTLCHLWHKNTILNIGQIFNRSESSSQAAIEFIGAGDQCRALSQFKPAPYWLIATPDSAIENIASLLATLPLNWEKSVVFHCSGALASQALQALTQQGAVCASVHPLHSFADPRASLKHLSGCYCAAEGDPSALRTIKPLFKALGLQWIGIEAENKLIYHAAAVFACNYLNTLLDASEQCLVSAGVSTPDPLRILMPLVMQTLQNIQRLGPQDALSGPLKRGDHDLIHQQINALDKSNIQISDLYRTLAQSTLPLTRLQLDEPELYSKLNQLFQST